MTAPAPNWRPLDTVGRIVALMTEFSIEATRPSAADIAGLSALKRGTRVYLSALPNRPATEPVDNAVRVRAAGLEPVPHVAVRNFASAAVLDEFLARLNGQAAVDSVLVVAGDRGESGPFRSALDVIDSGVLRRRGIRTVGIAGYPQGHPRIGDDELWRALTDKVAAAEAIGLTVEIVTQFSFDGRAILDFIAQLRGYGFDHRVRVGLAGPTNLTSLLRYASRCGVRASASAIAQRAGLMRQMFVMATPDYLIRMLADAAPVGVALHYFSFGGILATSRWTRAVADGQLVVEGDGFSVEPPNG